MEFAINDTPPTQEEINQEVEVLEKKIKKLKTRFYSFCLFVVILAIVSLSVLCFNDLLSGREVIAVAFAFVVATAFALAFAFAVASTLAFAFATVFAFAATLAFVVATEFAAAAVAVSFFASIFTGQVANLCNNQLTKYRDTLNSLTILPDESEECVPLSKACRSNEQCDEYRLAVLNQGRSLVKGEVDAMIQWHETSDQRAKEANDLHQHQAACAMLRSKEGLAGSVALDETN